jgi:hypothetical protein
MSSNFNDLMEKMLPRQRNYSEEEMAALMGRVSLVKQNITEKDIETEYLNLVTKYRGTIPQEEDLVDAYRKLIDAQVKMLPFTGKVLRSNANIKKRNEYMKLIAKASAQYEALKKYIQDVYERRKKSIKQSINNSKILEERGLGPVVYNTAIGGKYRRKNITRRKKHGLKSN